jgi:hypothetical protein
MFSIGRIFCGKPVTTFPENAPKRAFATSGKERSGATDSKEAPE